MKIKYKEIEVRKHQGKDALTEDQAKELLGWRVVEKGTGEFLFKDLEGNRIALDNNTANRPFRMGLAQRYQSEVLRGKWKFNGETWIVNRYAQIHSAQHRWCGLVLACQAYRKGDKGVWKKPPTMEGLLVLGVHEDTLDTNDLGQKRQLSDVIFQRHDFKDIARREQKRLASNLAAATRLVWLRTGGKKVSDAPHFPHSEALEFLGDHPRILEAVTFINECEGGRGTDGKRITNRISPGYAAGLLYLMAHSATEPAQWIAEGTMDETLWDKAEEFWTLFASGAMMAEGNPIMRLREVLVAIDSQQGQGRDDIVGCVIKAFNCWLDDPKAEVKGTDVKLKKRKDKTSGKMKATEEPRLGGLDFPVEEFLDAQGGTEDEGKTTPTTTKGKRTKGGWAAGDTCWVQAPDNVHWFGTVVSIGKTKASIKAAEDNVAYDAEIAALFVGYPTDVKAE